MSVSRARGQGAAPQEPDDDDGNGGSRAWKIPPFWHKLNSFFLFPFQMEPLIYSIILALCSYLLMLGGFFSLFVAAALVLAVSRYAFKVAALASRGITDSNDYRPHMMDSDWNALPWKFFGVLVVHLFWIGWLTKISPGFGALGSFLSSLAIPATLMVLINTYSLRASINPFNLLGTMAGIGLSYLLLCLFLFLLMQGAPMAISLLGPKVPKAMLIPSIAFVVIYFIWVMASMIGYVMYQNHAALDIQPVKPPEASATEQPEDPAAAETKRRDAAIAKYVQSGDMQSAIAHAREWQRTGYDNVADQRRFHRLIKLTDQTETLAMHAQSFVPLLLKQQRENEALEVWSSCVKRTPLFKFDTAETTLVLARSAWKNMQGPQVLGLLQGFERNFPDHPSTPEAQELIVRALKQGVNKPEQALRVFMRMKSRYPDHPSTKEAEWILRDELQRSMGATS